MSPLHETIVLERTYPATPARLFAAWASAEARLAWSAPDGAQLVFDQEDFRPGGVERSRCGPAGNLMFALESRYIDIRQNRLIHWLETCRHGETLLSSCLLTVEITADPASGGARLVLTDQVTAFDAEMIAGNRAGWSAVLEKLAAWLAPAAARA